MVVVKTASNAIVPKVLFAKQVEQISSRLKMVAAWIEYCIQLHQHITLEMPGADERYFAMQLLRIQNKTILVPTYVVEDSNRKRWIVQLLAL